MKHARRRFIIGSSASLLTVAGGFPVKTVFANEPNHLKKLIKKEILSSGEMLPAIGMGTWITFNVGNSSRLRNDRTKVLERFFKNGGTLIDSSPMYGSAEDVLGYCLDTLSTHKSFSATKTWTSSASEGREQFEDSKSLWRLPKFDLLQIHNLVAWRKHLPFLRELQQQGAIRYLGVTTSHGRRHDDIEQILKKEPLDFLQLTYNLADRETEKRLIPLAQDQGVSVICNRPFQGGRLPDHTKGKPVPEFASELDCDTWPQLLLKYVISHPGVTAAIPATSKTTHMDENMMAMYGNLPDNSQRQQIYDAFLSL